MGKQDRLYEQSMKTYVALIAFALLATGNLFSVEVPQPKNDAKEIFGPDPTKPVVERQVVVQVKPRKEIDASTNACLVLPLDGGESVKVYYDWKSPKQALPDKELTFALWQTKEVMWHTEDGQESFIWRTELDSIKDGRKVYFDAGVCPIHHISMTRGEVEIHYGLLAIDPKAWKTYSGGPGWVGGGCVIMEGAPSKDRGYICERCVAAYKKWSELERKKWEQRRAKEQSASGN
jgi:hypothetical protein